MLAAVVSLGSSLHYASLGLHRISKPCDLTWCYWLQTTMGVRERRGSLHRKGPTGGTIPGGSAPTRGSKDTKVLARALNSQIKQAGLATALISILKENVDASFFDPIHASTAYHQLATFYKIKQQPKPCTCQAASSHRGLHQAEWASANVMWALAVLRDELPLVIQLLPSLTQVFSAKVPGMKAQELSNSIWAAAQLKDVAPDVLKTVAAVVAEIPRMAVDMKPQELSNSLWAAAHLKDEAPDVLKIVPALVAQIPDKTEGMIPQDCPTACGQHRS